MACLRPMSSESGKSMDGKGQKSIIEIYTDWANHYLEKTRGKRRILNLETELSDGVVLCEVIEAVTQQKVPDVNKKPKTNAVIITNIQACLNFLRGKGVTVDDIQPEDIRDGNLKSILGLFFQLSRYKQQQKQLGMGRGSVPNSPAKTSSIPVPGSVMSPKRQVESKQEARSFLPASKHNGSSGIVRPGGPQDGGSEKAEIKPPSGRNGKLGGPVSNGTRQEGTKQSMLERLKMGRGGTQGGQIPSKPGLGKRTSSSSGFSSARSDRSESSGVSLSSDTNFPSPSALRRIQEAQESIPPGEQAQAAAVTAGRRSGIRSRFAPSSKEKSSSPKRSPRLGRSAAAGNGGVTEIKDYGPIDDGRPGGNGKPEKYPPHAYSRSNSGIAFKHTNISSAGRFESHSAAASPATSARGASKVPTVAASGLAAATASGGSKLGRVERGAAKKQPPAPPLRTNSIPPGETAALGIKGGQVDPVLDSDRPDADTESVCSSATATSQTKGGCSLPRQNNRTLSPSPNVAVVSPMPSVHRMTDSQKRNPDSKADKDGGELKRKGDAADEGPMTPGVVPPMAPLELFRSRKIGDKPSLEDANNSVSGDAGYVSDSDVIRNHRNKIDSGYVSEGGTDFLRRGVGGGSLRCGGNKSEDGYVSEGGAEFYSRKTEQRLAYERQRAEAENQHKLYLELSGKAGNRAEQVYKVVGGRRNVPKSDSGIQTELRSKHSSGGDTKVTLPGRMEKEELSAAMERNRMLLTSQEIAMQEYLKRQKKEAEKHIRNSPQSNRRNMNTVPGRQGGMMSMPGTPTGFRRNNGSSQHDLGSRYARGGSLERKVSLPDHRGHTHYTAAVSDSEYGAFRPANGGKENNSRSLPKGTSSLNYGLLVGQIQQKRQQKNRKDGNWSDSNYSTYTEIMSQKIGAGMAQETTQYGWLQPAQTYSGWSSPRTSHTTSATTNSKNNSNNCNNSADVRGSNESLNSISSSIRNARSLSLTRANVLAHSQKTGEEQGSYGKLVSPPRGVTRINNSEETEYYGIPFLTSTPTGSRFNSQPTSPVYGEHRSLAHDLSCPPLGGGTPRYSSLPPNVGVNGGKQPRQKPLGGYNGLGSKENLNGSRLSLASNESSVYGTQEEKTNADIAKLKRELAEEQSKVFCLTNQLNTNAHVVSAFEQSLSNMTSRLQEITRTAEKKDVELAELRRTIDVLRQSGVDAGLIKGDGHGGGYDLTRQMSTDSVASVTSIGEDEKDGSGTTGKKSSLSGPKRSGWLRSSFSKAFSKSKAGKGGSKGGSGLSDVEDSCTMREPMSLDMISTSGLQQEASSGLKASKSSSDLSKDATDADSEKILDDLKRQLIEKDTLLTETRLEALSSAHQLESLKDTVTKMKTELITLRQDNEKLQTQVVHKSLGSSESSLNTTQEQEGERRISVAVSEGSMISGPSTLDLSGTTDPSNQENKHLSVEVELSDSQESPAPTLRIGTIAASGKLSWELLDSLVERLFKEYIMRVDAVTHLGLGADSIHHYKVGEVDRRVKDANPELLPYGYLIGDVTSIRIILKNTENSGGVDAVALETLTPKSIVQRYISMLQDHRRVMLAGPSGQTGKTYLAVKLAHLLISHNAAKESNLQLEHFEVTKSNSQEFVELVQRINKETEEHASTLPFVLILDNLHLVSNVELILSQHLNFGAESGPFIIGTMLQSSSNNSTNLQLKHNFRWILCANHIEPVRGLLSRYLKRRLLSVEAETRQFNPEASKIVDWVAKSLLSVNKFLETHCSPESTLSPTLFMTCPLDSSEAARLWFTNLWNLTIVPHILDAVSEGLQAYGRRSSWEDPLHSLRDNWPWQAAELDGLVTVRPEDVAFESYPMARPVSGHSTDAGLEDPLFNMLMTLQEAATNQSGHDI